MHNEVSERVGKVRSPNFERGPNSGRWQFNHEFLDELSTRYAVVNGRYVY